MSQDWMTSNHRPAPKPQSAYPEQTLWTLTKEARTAVALVRRLPQGKELRLFVDGMFYDSRLFAVDADIEMIARAEAFRRAFEARGWL